MCALQYSSYICTVCINLFISRCSFHAYADSTYAKHLENGASLYGTVAAAGPTTPLPPMMMIGGNTFLQNGGGDIGGGGGGREFQQSVMEMSDDSLTSVDRLDDWRQLNGGGGGSGDSPPQSVPNRQQQQQQTNGNSSPNENGKCIFLLLFNFDKSQEF